MIAGPFSRICSLTPPNAPLHPAYQSNSRDVLIGVLSIFKVIFNLSDDSRVQRGHLSAIS